MRVERTSILLLPFFCTSCIMHASQNRYGALIWCTITVMVFKALCKTFGPDNVQRLHSTALRHMHSSICLPLKTVKRLKCGAHMNSR